MSRLQSRSSGSISLFPFLAVLICAMGALIFLLIVFTRQMREQAMNQVLNQEPVAKAEISVVPDSFEDSIEKVLAESHALVLSETVTEKPKLNVLAKPVALKPVKNPVVQIDPNEKLKQKLKNLDHLKKQVFQIWSKNQQKLIQEQSKSEQAEKKIASMIEELELLELQQELFDEKTKRVSKNLKYTSFAEQQIKKKINKSKQKKHQVKNQYAFVPYDGKSGTTRRPLLVECTGSVVRILPENIEFTPEDFKGYPRHYNPVLVVLEALVKYWSTHSEGYEKPYVLIIIRPGGGAAYYTTRKYISTLDADVGYELVEKDWELASSEVNPEAKDVAMKALEKLLEERRIYMESMVRKNRDGYSDEKPGRGLNNGMNKSLAIRGRGSVIVPGKINGSKQQGQHSRSHSGMKASPNGQTKEPGEPGIFKYPPKSNNQQKAEEGQAESSGIGSRISPDKTTGNRFAESQNEKSDEGFSIHSIREKTPESFMEHVRQYNKQKKTTKGSQKHNNNLSGSRNPSGSSTRSPSSRSSSQSRSNAGSSSSSEPSDHSLPPVPQVTINQPKNENESLKPKKKWGLYQAGATIGFERNIPIHFKDRMMSVNGTEIDLNQIESYEELVKVLEDTTERTVRSWGYPPKSFYWIPNLTFHIYPDHEKEVLKLTSKLKARDLPSKIKFVEEGDE